MALALCGPKVGGAIEETPLDPAPDSKPEDAAYILGYPGILYNKLGRSYQHPERNAGPFVRSYLRVIALST